jgi:hypothetical protein
LATECVIKATTCQPAPAVAAGGLHINCSGRATRKLEEIAVKKMYIVPPPVGYYMYQPGFNIKVLNIFP